MALLIQAHDRSLYRGREPQRILIITQITAGFGPNQQLTIQSSLAFPLLPCHALPMLYLEPALTQV